MTGKAVIPIYSDYASSLCYIAKKIMDALEEELAVELLWKGVQISRLQPGWKPGEALGERERGKILRVSHETGIDLRIPQRWLNSAPALEGALWAKEKGKFRQYHSAVFAAAFTEGRDIGDVEVLGSLVEGLGLDAQELMEHLQAGTFTARVQENEAEARRLGVVGYPTFMLGDFPLIGIQPRETMKLLLRRYLEKAQKRLFH